MFEPGQVLGDYTIEAAIGSGGMCRVYRARHTLLETMHALKVLDPKYRFDPDVGRRFLDEAKIQAKHLNHPNILKVTNIFANADVAAIVMELIDDGSLEDLIAGSDRGLSLSEFLGIALPILGAIQHAHAAGIIHRDLKPANVLIAKIRGTHVPYVCDFGIAKLAAELSTKKKSTVATSSMGTIEYMSPEQIKRSKDVTNRSDIFSLGAMFYEMVTGSLPFEADSEYEIMDKIVRGTFHSLERAAPEGMPAAIVHAIHRALSVDPNDRFASCNEFIAALRHAPTAAPVRGSDLRDGRAAAAPARSVRESTHKPRLGQSEAAQTEEVCRAVLSAASRHEAMDILIRPEPAGYAVVLNGGAGVLDTLRPPPKTEGLLVEGLRKLAGTHANEIKQGPFALLPAPFDVRLYPTNLGRPLVRLQVTQTPSSTRTVHSAGDESGPSTSTSTRAATGTSPGGQESIEQLCTELLTVASERRADLLIRPEPVGYAVVLQGKTGANDTFRPPAGTEKDLVRLLCAMAGLDTRRVKSGEVGCIDVRYDGQPRTVFEVRVYATDMPTRPLVRLRRN